MKSFLTLLFMIVSLQCFGQGDLSGSLKGDLQTTKNLFGTLEVPNSQSTKTGAVSAKIETGNKNILANPSFDASTLVGWSINGASNYPALDVSDVIDGKKSALFAPLAGSIDMSQSTIAYATAFAGGVQGLASIRIKGDIPLQFCTISAGVVSTTNCLTTKTDNKWKFYKLPVILGATSNGISIKSAAGVTGTVNIDDAFLGMQDLKQETQAAVTQVWYGEQATVFAANTAPVVPTYPLAGSGSGLFSYSAGTYTFLKASKVIAMYSFNAVSNTIVTGVIRMGGTDNCAASTAASAGAWASCTVVRLVQPGDTLSLYNYSNSTGAQKLAISATETVNNSTYSSFNGNTSWAPCGHTAADFTGLGTVTIIETQCKRDGDDLLMKGKFLSGTHTNVEARIALKFQGSTLTTKSSANLGPLQVAGSMDTQQNSATYFGGRVLIEPSVSYVTTSIQSSTSNSLVKTNGTGWTSGSVFSFTARVPIEGWDNSNIIIGSFNGIEKCRDTYECTDEFTAEINANATIYAQNVPWLASCVYSSGFICTLNNGLVGNGQNLTTPMECTVSTGHSGGVTAGVPIVYLTSATLTGVSYITANGAVATTAGNATIRCNKKGADLIGKTAKAVASDQNVRAIGSIGVDVQSVYFGAGSDCATVCSAGNCVICNQVGSKISSVTWQSAGVYRLNGIDGTKYNCSGSAGASAYKPALHKRASSTSSYAYIETGSVTTLSNSNEASITCIGVP